MRTERDIRRNLETYIYPHWAERDFASIKRSDISALMDRIEDERGSRTADLVKAYASSIASWYALRNDSYTTPFTRGMRRHTKPPRARILGDAELRTIWKTAEANGKFGAFVQLLLLTGQRSEKVRTVKWADVALDGTWVIATEEREKPNAGSLILPPLALQIIQSQPRVGSYVFPGRSNKPMDISNAKYLFDEKLPSMPHWTLHDLRRSCRSLLARCGVVHEIAERILGHRVGSDVSRTYDRHDYADEKRIALAKLAQLIDSIVNERKNVVPLAKGRRAKS